MTPSDDARDPRSIELAIEVLGTPEQVWEAIASGPGITAWLHPTELDQREGGRMTYDMGDGMGGAATVRGWDPPRRYVEEGEWQIEGAPPARLATEWRVEARAGGTCVVRMVTSGFGTAAGWDQEIEGFTEAMETALENLRLYLTHFPGAPGAWVRVFGSAPGSRAEGFAALLGALGLADVRRGARVAASGPGVPALAGTVRARGRRQVAAPPPAARRGAGAWPRQRRHLGRGEHGDRAALPVQGTGRRRGCARGAGVAGLDGRALPVRPHGRGGGLAAGAGGRGTNGGRVGKGDSEGRGGRGATVS